MLQTVIRLLQKIKRDKLARYRHHFNWLATWLYYDPDVYMIPKHSIDYIVVDGLKYRYDGCSDGIVRQNSAFFQGVLHGDIALDIGANIGDVAIPLSRLCTKVVAVEPLYAKKLLQNIIVNEIGNIAVIDAALADKPTPEYRVACQGRSAIVKGITFRSMLTAAGNVNFLHVDAEGAAWCINKEDCAGIREMRFEFHLWRRNFKKYKQLYNDWLIWLSQNGYRVEVSRSPLSSTVDFRELWNVAAHKISGL